MFFLPDVIVLGDLTFFALLAGFITIEVLWTSFRRRGWATFTLISFGILMYFLLGNTVRSFFLYHWQTFLLAVAVYIVGGFLWGIMKWFIFCHRRARVFAELKAKYYADNKIPLETSLKDLNAYGEARSKENKENNRYWADGAVSLDKFGHLLTEDERWEADSHEFYREVTDFIPNVTKNKARIMGWMIWWVFDIICTILNNFIHDFFDALYSWAKGTMQLIANRTFKRFEKDLS